MSDANIFDILPEEKFEEGYDPTFAGLPLRKGRYEATVKFRINDVPIGERFGLINGSPMHVYAKLMAHIEGKGFADGFISTKPFKAGSDTEKLTSTAVRFLRSLGQRELAIAADTPKKLAEAIGEVIGEDGVRAVVNVNWETDSCRDCRDRGLKNSKNTPISVRGEDNFPHDAEGNPIPEADCPTCGATLRAQAKFNVVGAG